ncbi:cytochrome c family protein [Verrucomicrobiales bacterium]|nr:cytochrome c family protein [Verrucomicrobiales bacterium]
METCADCHNEMADAWNKTAHASSFEDLIERPNAAKMAAILKIDRAEIPVSASCVR